nr:MAG TPA: hypothetical protein [Caudoviricetes sp.]
MAKLCAIPKQLIQFNTFMIKYVAKYLFCVVIKVYRVRKALFYRFF